MQHSACWRMASRKQLKNWCVYSILVGSIILVVIEYIVHDSQVTMATGLKKSPNKVKSRKNISLVNQSPPHQKQFIYLLQYHQPKNDKRLVVNNNRDVVWLTFDKRAKKVPGLEVITHMGSWTEGRNALLEYALNKVRQTNSSGYLYYIFMDGDMVDCINGARAWEKFEAFLLDKRPSQGYMSWSAWHVFKHIKKTQYGIYNRGLFNIDANVNAFHRNTIGTLLPYDTSLDSLSIYNSAYIVSLMGATTYASSRLGINNQTFNLGRNTHNVNSKRYNRTINFAPVKRHIYDMFKTAELKKALDVVNCNKTDVHIFCDYAWCERQLPVARISDSWIKKNLDLTHKYAKTLWEWRQHHKDVLSKMQADSPPYVTDVTRSKCH